MEVVATYHTTDKRSIMKEAIEDKAAITIIKMIREATTDRTTTIKVDTDTIITMATGINKIITEDQIKETTMAFPIEVSTEEEVVQENILIRRFQIKVQEDVEVTTCHQEEEETSHTTVSLLKMIKTENMIE